MKEKIKFIRELAQSMNENKIEEVQYEENNFEIQLRKKGKEKQGENKGKEYSSRKNSSE